VNCLFAAPPELPIFILEAFNLWLKAKKRPRKFTRQESTPAGCSKSPFNKAAGESKPEAYPLGYVEDFDEPRTKLAGFFSILLGPFIRPS
jgi:hypothetical protein